MQKSERGDDTVGDHGDRSLRSRTGEAEDEAVVGDLAPQAPSHAGGEGFEVLKWTHRNICDMAAVKRKRQFEEGKNDRKTARRKGEKTATVIDYYCCLMRYEINNNACYCLPVGIELEFIFGLFDCWSGSCFH